MKFKHFNFLLPLDNLDLTAKLSDTENITFDVAWLGQRNEGETTHKTPDETLLSASNGKLVMLLCVESYPI